MGVMLVLCWLAGAFAVQVVTVEDNKFVFNEDALSRILLNQAYRSLPVVVVSVAGVRFRTISACLVSFWIVFSVVLPLRFTLAGYFG